MLILRVFRAQRLKAHYAQYEPTLRELKAKYESLMKEKTLTRLERDRLAAKVRARVTVQLLVSLPCIPVFQASFFAAFKTVAFVTFVIFVTTRRKEQRSCESLMKQKIVTRLERDRLAAKVRARALKCSFLRANHLMVCLSLSAVKVLLPPRVRRP